MLIVKLRFPVEISYSAPNYDVKFSLNRIFSSHRGMKCEYKHKTPAKRLFYAIYVAKRPIKYCELAYTVEPRLTTTPIFRPLSKVPLNYYSLTIVLIYFRNTTTPKLRPYFLAPWVVVILRFHCTSYLKIII